jgi:hypothetical protein
MVDLRFLFGSSWSFSLSFSICEETDYFVAFLWSKLVSPSPSFLARMMGDVSPQCMAPHPATGVTNHTVHVRAVGGACFAEKTVLRSTRTTNDS